MDPSDVTPAPSLLNRDLLQCQPSTGISLRIATFFVLSIICHAATLHTAPGQIRRVVLARGLGMIFSPVTAGLFSLMSLGRMGVAWISIMTRFFGLIAQELEQGGHGCHNHIVEMQEITVEITAEMAAEADTSEGNPTAPTSTAEPTHEVRGHPGRTQSDPGPSVPRLSPLSRHTIPHSNSVPTIPHSKSTPIQLDKTPIKSTISLVKIALNPKELTRHSKNINFHEDLPHRLHTRAVIAGAVAIHVPRHFWNLLRGRNWECLSDNQFREVVTEYNRTPEGDIAFDEYLQFILPPTAVVLDSKLRLHPGSLFREAAGGLLQ